jgi:signal transduction histidine kinase
VLRKNPSKRRLTPSSLALIYVLISLAWVIGSSELLYIEFESAAAITAFEIAKGAAFILLTGALLYWVTRRLLDHLLSAERALQQSEQQRRFLENQLRTAQKLDALGRLSGGITHDFNNILTIILSSAHLLEKDLAEGPARDRVKLITSAAEKGAALIQQLLAFSRCQALEPRLVNLNDVIRQNSSLLQSMVGKAIRLQLDLDPGLREILADPTQIAQVLMNLSLNARDAMAAGGVLEIQTANVTGEEELLVLLPEIDRGNNILLRVKDQGAGIAPEHCDQIFDPFFTTKPQGTGLGLSTVYGIVKQSGGTIDFKTEAGKGTEFLLYFPERAASEKPSTLRANAR